MQAFVVRASLSGTASPPAIPICKKQKHQHQAPLTSTLRLRLDRQRTVDRLLMAGKQLRSVLQKTLQRHVGVEAQAEQRLTSSIAYQVFELQVTATCMHLQRHALGPSSFSNLIHVARLAVINTLRMFCAGKTVRQAFH